MPKILLNLDYKVEAMALDWKGHYLYIDQALHDPDQGRVHFGQQENDVRGQTDAARRNVGQRRQVGRRRRQQQRFVLQQQDVLQQRNVPAEQDRVLPQRKRA